MFDSTNKNFWIVSTSLLISLFIIIFIGLSTRLLPPKLPFFYSLPWGDKQLADHSQLLIIPAIITLVTLCNLIISWQLHSSQLFFKNILLYTSILSSLVLAITFLKIVLIFI